MHVRIADRLTVALEGDDRLVGALRRELDPYGPVPGGGTADVVMDPAAGPAEGDVAGDAGDGWVTSVGPEGLELADGGHRWTLSQEPGAAALRIGIGPGAPSGESAPRC